MDKAREAVTRGAEEARNYASGSTGSGYARQHRQQLRERQLVRHADRAAPPAGLTSAARKWRRRLMARNSRLMGHQANGLEPRALSPDP